MIRLHVERANGPGVRFTDATDFLFDECCKLAHQNPFPVLGTPDKVIGQLIHDVFGGVCQEICGNGPKYYTAVHVMVVAN